MGRRDGPAASQRFADPVIRVQKLLSVAERQVEGAEDIEDMRNIHVVIALRFRRVVVILRSSRIADLIENLPVMAVAKVLGPGVVGQDLVRTEPALYLELQSVVPTLRVSRAESIQAEVLRVVTQGLRDC